MRLFRTDPDACAAIVRLLAHERRRPPMNAGEILDGLAPDAPVYAKAMREQMGLLFVPLAAGEVARLRAIIRDENEHIDDLVVRAVRACIADSLGSVASPRRRPGNASAGVTVALPAFLLDAVRHVGGEQHVPHVLADAVRRWLAEQPS